MPRRGGPQDPPESGREVEPREPPPAAGRARIAPGIDWAATPLGPPEQWPEGLRPALEATVASVARRLAAEIAEDERRRRGELLESFLLAETRFAQFMQHLPGLAWIKDLDGRYVYANDAAEAAFRRPRAELYGRTDEEIFPPATAAQFREHDRRALSGESGTQVLETLEHADGSVHSSIVTKFRIPDARGEPALLGGMAIDVTDRVRAEQALREADRRKDDFLAILAHELRNPLSSIRNALLVVSRSRDAAAVAAATDIMERQVGHVVRLVEDLLDVSRITRGKVELRREAVELPGDLRHCLESARELAAQRGLELETALPEQPLVVDADPVRLAQVVDNLIANAVKFTEPGGRIALSIRRAETRAEIRVADTGMGIDPSHLPGIFDLFAQADETADLRSGGLGIGLTVVRDLVALHGGTVEASSAGRGRGSEFVVRLPLRGAVPAPAPRAATPATALATRRILILDHDRDAAESLAAALGLIGHVVRTATDGEAALAAAAELGADTVLVDLGLSDSGGYRTARRIREQPWGRGLVLVAVARAGGAEERARAGEAGFDAHLVRPVDHAALTRLLSEIGRFRSG